jgi:hypothetical protein
VRISIKSVLLPILFVNITAAANLWTFLGVPIGPVLYYLAIGLVLWRVWHSPYRLAGAVLVLATLGLKVAGAAGAGEALDPLATVTVGLLFSLAGALVYGDDPGRLHRQLMIFFAISVPLMFAQKAGVSTALLVWNTEVFHENDIYEFDEDDIGTLEYVAPLSKTLFKQSDEFVYTVAQGRPSGLSYSNNVLSVFLVMAFALNLFLRSPRLLLLSDVVMALSLALVMSLTALGGSILLTVGFALWGPTGSVRRALRTLGLIGLAFGLHWFLFPGVTEGGFGRAKLITSLVGRLGEVAFLLNLSSLSALLNSQASSIGLRFVFEEGSSYSLVGFILRNRVALMALALAPAAGWIYWRALRRMGRSSPYAPMYAFFLFSCLITQLGVPYIGAPSYQYLMGFGLVPLLPAIRLRLDSSKVPSASTDRRFPGFFASPAPQPESNL